MRVILALFAFSLGWAATWSVAQPLHMLALGDSLTEGDGDDGSGGGYPPRVLALVTPDHPGSTMENLGISGDTSDDLINKQLQPALTSIQSAPTGSVPTALVWIGSNDLFGLYNSVCDDEFGNNYSQCEDTYFGYYSENIQHILETLRGAGADVYIALLDDQSRRPVMTDPAMRNAVYDRMSDEDVQRMSAQVSRYNAEIQRLAGVYGAVTVDFFNTTFFENWATLSPDGNHPNGAGYDAIAQIWAQALGSGSVVVPDSHRWIPHVTSPTGGFVTRVLAHSSGEGTTQVNLQPFDQSGSPLTAVTLSLIGGNVHSWMSGDLFGNETVSHFSVTAEDDVTLSVAYRVAQGEGASAHVHESAITGREFMIYPGEQDVVFDGLALINRGSQPARISLSLINAQGEVLLTEVLDEALATHAKLLATLDRYDMNGVAAVTITSDQDASVLFLRGTRPGTSPGYLYQTLPIVSTAP